MFCSHRSLSFSSRHLPQLLFVRRKGKACPFSSRVAVCRNFSTSGATASTTISSAPPTNLADAALQKLVGKNFELSGSQAAVTLCYSIYQSPFSIHTHLRSGSTAYGRQKSHKCLIIARRLASQPLSPRTRKQHCFAKPTGTRYGGLGSVSDGAHRT